jgi:hypothetical protein
MKTLTAEEFKTQIRSEIRRDNQEGVRQTFWARLFQLTWW